MALVAMQDLYGLGIFKIQKHAAGGDLNSVTPRLSSEGLNEIFAYEVLHDLYNVRHNQRAKAERSVAFACPG